MATTETETAPGPTCQTASTLAMKCTSIFYCVITSGVICVLKFVLCSPSDSHSDDMHMQLLYAHFSTCRTAPWLHVHFTTIMQLLHAHSAPACTRSGSPHNVLHSPSNIANRDETLHLANRPAIIARTAIYGVTWY